MFLSSHAILKSISIHAPAKGATYNLTNAGIVRLFQSTLPRRERQNGLQKIRKHMHFNPRSREGSDVVFIHWSFIVAYFNPRSREGSDFPLFRNLPLIRKFQSTLPRRERRCRQSCSAPDTVHFNPRSREGSDDLTDGERD